MPRISSRKWRKNKLKSKLQANSGFWVKRKIKLMSKMMRKMMNSMMMNNKKKRKKKYKFLEMMSKIMIYFDLIKTIFKKISVAL